jgi:RNA polymerase sigma-70 factor (ECF subfamily)
MGMVLGDTRDDSGDLGRTSRTNPHEMQPDGNRGAAPVDAEKQVQAFLDGQTEAVRLITDWVESIAMHKTWGNETQEDMIQAILLTLIQNFRRGKFREGNLRAYVRRIAKNMCIDNYRMARNRGRHVSLQDQMIESSDRYGGDSIERQAMLERILERIDDTCRKILRLAYVKGYSRKEISEMLGVEEATVRIRLFRCVHKTRSLLDESNGKTA